MRRCRIPRVTAGARARARDPAPPCWCQSARRDPLAVRRRHASRWPGQDTAESFSDRDLRPGDGLDTGRTFRLRRSRFGCITRRAHRGQRCLVAGRGQPAVGLVQSAAGCAIGWRSGSARPLWCRHGDPVRAALGAARGRTLAFTLIAFGLLGFLVGALVGGVWLAFIGWFIFAAARDDVTQILTRHALAGVKVAGAMTANPQHRAGSAWRTSSNTTCWVTGIRRTRWQSTTDRSQGWSRWSRCAGLSPASARPPRSVKSLCHCSSYRPRP